VHRLIDLGNRVINPVRGTAGVDGLDDLGVVDALQVRARLTARASVRTSCSRPRRSLVTRPARSNTATCFCTAAKLIG
jgi:hypothetical protein